MDHVIGWPCSAHGCVNTYLSYLTGYYLAFRRYESCGWRLVMVDTYTGQGYEVDGGLLESPPSL